VRGEELGTCNLARDDYGNSEETARNMSVKNEIKMHKNKMHGWLQCERVWFTLLL
jgi:hypothetical protein